jgi:hypothetical protein
VEVIVQAIVDVLLPHRSRYAVRHQRRLDAPGYFRS